MKVIVNRFYILTIVLIFTACMLVACGSVPETLANEKKANEIGQQGDNLSENNLLKDDSSDVDSADTNENKINEKFSGQCKLTKAPEIKGFALGQTVDEINTQIPGFKEVYEKEKQAEIEQNKKANFVVLISAIFPDNSKINSEEFKDLSFIWHFLDDKLIGYVVKYLDNETAELNLQQFLNKMAKENNLPKDGWKIGKEDDAELNCQSFEAIITAGGQPGMGIMLFDKEGERIKDERMRKVKSPASQLTEIVTTLTPPTNIRATPNGKVLCVIKKQGTFVKLFGSTDITDKNGEWYYTNFCGKMGVIHSTQFVVPS